MILVAKKRPVVVVNASTGMSGHYRLRCIRPNGDARIDTGWFKNTLLYNGLNEMAQRGDWMDYCQVGTGTTFPAALEDRRNETSLEAFHAGTSTIQSETGGTVAANLSEVGVGWSAAGGSTLISRAQILDPSSGTPTTVTPLVDEMLEVTYELRYYAPTVDVTRSAGVTLNGVDYDVTTRAAAVTGSFWYNSIGSQMGYAGADTDWRCYDGNISAVTSGPSGTSALFAGSWANGAYSNNSYQMEISANCTSGGWNLGGGIRSIAWATTAGRYQTEFSATTGGATIPKTSSYTMAMKFEISWAEL
jgi:hypothetical protein